MNCASSSEIKMVLPEELKLLDSHQQQDVEEAKKCLHEHFNSSKESWLIAGLVDYFINTGSMRIIDVILAVREPHDTYFFNKMFDSLKNSPTTRLSVLTLLSHVVFRQPTWLYKISQHNVFKELLSILKTETDIVILISALLTLVVLLPMIPAYVGNTLPEIFDVFKRLAAWNTINPHKLNEDQMYHLQISLHFLFHRLYGMYPCNFLTFLRQQYGTKENLRVFSQTIKPMLETVRMHPLLVTTSKEMETTTKRWKTMEHHDVVTECAKLSVDVKDVLTSPVSTFRARNEFELHRIFESTSFRDLKMVQSHHAIESNDLWRQQQQPSSSSSSSAVISSSSPCLLQGQSSQEGTSPPEAAVEATPESTPVKEQQEKHVKLRQPPNPTIARALNRSWNVSTTSSSTTPSQSQPSSPVRKEISPFRFNDSEPLTVVQRQLQAILQDRLNATDIKPKLENNSNGAVKVNDSYETYQDEKEALTSNQQFESRFDSLSEKPSTTDNHQQYDNVLQNFHPEHTEEVELEPDEPSFYHDRGILLRNGTFRQNVRNRLRYYSQCGADLNLHQMAAELKQNRSRSRENLTPVYSPKSTSVRRANSCPEIKKKRTFTGPEQDLNQEHLDETLEEQESIQDQDKQNNEEQTPSLVKEKERKVSIGVQSDPVAIYPYEHLLFTLYPVYSNENLPSTPTPTSSARNSAVTNTPSIMLDRYLECAANAHAHRSIDTSSADWQSAARVQFSLLHLQLKFERHRRDVHEERNRRLLGKSRNNRWLEEHNAALQDQLALLEKDIENLHSEIGRNKEEQRLRESKLQETINFWQEKYSVMERECTGLRADKEAILVALKESQNETAATTKKVQQLESQVFALGKELKEAEAVAMRTEQLRQHNTYLQKDLIVLGEAHTRTKSQLTQLALTAVPPNQTQVQHACYLAELRGLTAQLETSMSNADACKARVVDLEFMLARKDMLIAEQKRALKTIKEQCKEQLDAVETKYNAQKAINCKLESQLLEVNSRLDAMKTKSSRRNAHALPSTNKVSSAQDVLQLADEEARGGIGCSPPLSVSLSSSEGLSLSSVHEPPTVRDLQSLVEGQAELTAAVSSSPEHFEQCHTQP